MKRVRVCKEMPFAKVGEELEVKMEGDWQYIETGGERPIMQYPVIALINRGWLEWVEEDKSLEEKIYNWYTDGHYIECTDKWDRDNAKELAQIAKDYHLAVFDKERRDNRLGTIQDLRKALESA